MIPSIGSNSLPVKIGDWKTIFLLGRPIFRGYVSFWEGMFYEEFGSYFGGDDTKSNFT